METTLRLAIRSPDSRRCHDRAVTGMRGECGAARARKSVVASRAGWQTDHPCQRSFNAPSCGAADSGAVDRPRSARCLRRRRRAKADDWAAHSRSRLNSKAGSTTARSDRERLPGTLTTQTRAVLALRPSERCSIVGLPFEAPMRGQRGAPFALGIHRMDSKTAPEGTFASIRW